MIPDALPDRCRALWGGGDWTPRPGGGVQGLIGYLEIRVWIWQGLWARVWIWQVATWDRRRGVWAPQASGSALDVAGAVAAAAARSASVTQ